MRTITYIKMLSILESETDSDKELRLWTLNLSDDLASAFISTVNNYTVTFIKSMANLNVTDGNYLFECLNFIVNNSQNPNIEYALRILSRLNQANNIGIAASILQATSYQIEGVATLLSLSLSQDVLDYALELVMSSNTVGKSRIIAHIFAKTPNLPQNACAYFFTKLQEASDTKAEEDVLIEYNGYATNSNDFHHDLGSIPSLDLIKILEHCPDMFDTECSAQTLELALFRSKKRQAKVQ